MKKLFSFVVGCLIAFPTFAESVFSAKIDVQCVDDFPALQKRILESHYKETTHWAGMNEETNSLMIIYTNEETKTWTLVQTDGKIACILAGGINARNVEQVEKSTGGV